MLKALEPEEASCLECKRLQLDDGDPKARCETHTVDETPIFERTDVERWGPRLPIGTLKSSGQLAKGFALS